MTDAERARAFFGCEEDEIQIAHRYRCASERGAGCEALAALLAEVRQEERERCAKVASEHRYGCPPSGYETAQKIAAAIRAGKEGK